MVPSIPWQSAACPALAAEHTYCMCPAMPTSTCCRSPVLQQQPAKSPQLRQRLTCHAQHRRCSTVARAAETRATKSLDEAEIEVGPMLVPRYQRPHMRGTSEMQALSALSSRLLACAGHQQRLLRRLCESLCLCPHDSIITATSSYAAALSSATGHTVCPPCHFKCHCCLQPLGVHDVASGGTERQSAGPRPAEAQAMDKGFVLW